MACTLPESDIAPQHESLEDDEIPFGMTYFQRLCWFSGVYPIYP